MINDTNKSDESFSSSISSSFADLENFHKFNFNEEDMWKKIFSQPTTSCTTIDNIKYIGVDSGFESHDNEENNENVLNRSNEIVTEEEKNTLKTENETKCEPEEKSFAELLESYNSRYKTNIEQFNRQISVPRIFNDLPVDDSRISDSVSIKCCL